MHLSKIWAAKEGYFPRNVIKLEKIVKTLLIIREKVICMHITVCMYAHTYLCILKDIKNREIERKHDSYRNIVRNHEQ